MKARKFYLVLALTLVAVLTLGACARDQTETPELGITEPAATETTEPLGTEPGEPTEEVATETAEPMEATETPQEGVGEGAAPHSVLVTTVLEADIYVGGEVDDTASVADVLMDPNGDLRWYVIDDADADGTVLVDPESYTLEIREEDQVRLTAQQDPLAGAETIDLDAVFGGDAYLDEDADLPAAITSEQLVRASRFTDFVLQNDNGEDLGEVSNLVVRVENNQVSYAVVDIGGFLGIGENTILIPWEQLQLETPEDGDQQPQLVLPGGTQERLSNAPTVNLDELDLHEEGWQQEHEDFWATGG